MFKNVKKIEQHLFELQDKKYKEFHKGLVPNIDEESIIGIRVPVLRKYAKSLMKENYVQEFLDNLPHKYNDENQLHSLLLSDIKDFDVCVKEVERFLPYVNYSNYEKEIKIKNAIDSVEGSVLEKIKRNYCLISVLG